VSVPLYDYRCRTCDDTFEVRRPMAESEAPVACPSGHRETVKLLAFAAVGGRAGEPAGAAGPMPSGGGCCGGACGCG
jgi:putative FmdB family regulatory protein